MFVLNNNRWILVDQAIPSVAQEPTAPHPLLWVEDGGFAFCSGTAADDCRYGRVFDDYRKTEVNFPAGRAFVINGSALPNFSIPSGETRQLDQEP